MKLCRNTFKAERMCATSSTSNYDRTRIKTGSTLSRLCKVGDLAEISAQHVGSITVRKGGALHQTLCACLSREILGNKTAGTCHNLPLSQQAHPASRGNLTHYTCMYSARICPWYPHSVCSSCTPSSFSTHRKSCTCVAIWYALEHTPPRLFPR